VNTKGTATIPKRNTFEMMSPNFQQLISYTSIIRMIDHGIVTLSNYATQRNPFLQTIAPGLRLSLLRKPFKLSLYNLSYFISSNFHRRYIMETLKLRWGGTMMSSEGFFYFEAVLSQNSPSLERDFCRTQA
jgi:hypothetical protein